MATSSSRDVTLTLKVDTIGEDGIQQLQSEFAKLAKEGANAGPEFQQLADQIARLGDQNQALGAFRQLSAATDELRANQAAAGFQLDATATKLTELKVAAGQAADSQKAAAQAVLTSQKAYVDLGTQIKILKSEYDSAGKQTQEYKDALGALLAKQSDVKIGLIELQAAQREANAEVRQADQGLAKLTEEYNRQTIALDRNATALRQQDAALESSRAGVEALGVSLDSVSAAEAQLINTFNRGVVAVEQNAKSVRDLALAQGFLTTELNLQAAAAQRLIAEEQRLAQQQQAAAQAVAAAAQAAGAAAAASAAQISNAFKTVGVRSAQELEKEIQDVRAAMETLRTSSTATGASLNGAFAAGNAKIKSLERDLRELSGSLTLADKAANLFSNSMGQIAAGNLIADAVGYLVNKVKELGRAFLDTVVQSDQLRRGLNAIYKDVGVVTSQIDFLRKSSQESGVAFSGLSQEFVKFSASMKSANIPLQQSNELFKAVTAAGASLGLTAEDVGGTLNALGQIASKSTVSMEELRQQLGDRLPGALGLTAKAMGITEAQLVKLVESGGLAARDFFGPFTQGLKELRGESDGLVPTFERLKGAFQTVAAGFGDAGGVVLLTGALKTLGAVVAVITAALSGFAETLFLTGSAVVAFFARLSGDKQAFDFFNEQVAKSAERLREQRQAFVLMIDPSKAATEAIKGQAAALTTSTAETVKNINANTQLTASQKLAALSTALAADATLNASAKLVQYNVAAAEFLKMQAVQIESAQKLAKAAKEQGDTLIALAKISGDQSAVARAASEAANLHAAALVKVSEAQREELAMLQAQREELVANSQARGISAEQIKVQTDALDAKIKKSEAETEQAKQATAAALQEVNARKLVLETIGDQSARVAEYTKSLAELTESLKAYEVLQAQGLVTAEQVTALRERVATATAKLRDAQADLNEKTKQEAEFRRDSLRIASDTLNSEIALYQAKAQIARSAGDVTLAIHYENEAKKKKIEIDKLAIQIKEIELKLERQEIEVRLQKLKLEEPENTLKRQKLELDLKLNDLKGQGIKASKELLAIQDLELAKSIGLSQAIRQEGSARDENTSAMSRQTSATEQLIAARERELAVAEKALELERKRLQIDKEGFSTDKGGNRIVAGSDLMTATGIKRFLQEAGVVDEEQAIAITREFLDTQGNVPYFDNQGQKKYGGDTLSMALLKAAEKVTFGYGGGSSSAPTGGGRGAPPPQPQAGGFTQQPQAPTQTSQPARTGDQAGASGGRAPINLSINVGAGVNMSNRAEVEKLARVIMPAITDLQRRGLSG